MFTDITIDCAIAKVVFNHPDDSSKTKYIALDLYNYDAGDYYTDKELRARIEFELNPYHYWHELDITLIFPFALDAIEEGTFSYKLEDE